MKLGDTGDIFLFAIIIISTIICVSGIIFISISDSGSTGTNREIAKTWVEKRKIEGAIIECFGETECDVSYRENGKLHLVKLICENNACRLANQEGE